MLYLFVCQNKSRFALFWKPWPCLQIPYNPGSTWWWNGQSFRSKSWFVDICHKWMPTLPPSGFVFIKFAFNQQQNIYTAYHFKTITWFLKSQLKDLWKTVWMGHSLSTPPDWLLSLGFHRLESRLPLQNRSC